MPAIDLATQCSIGVVIRDRLSVVPRCLDALAAQGLDGIRTVAVVGGASPELQRAWRDRYPWVEFVYSAEKLPPGRSRNLALERVDTPAIALLDADVVGSPEWLARCQARRAQSGAAVVVPLVLEAPNRVHSAGNLEYVNHERGISHLHKELRFAGMPYGDSCELQACEVDYGESHCLVCDVEALRAAGGFDDALIEFGEVDLGRRVRRIGRSVWFEPQAVVHFWLDAPIELEDVETFIWRWDRERIAESYRRFAGLWGVDIAEQGGFDDFVAWYNAKLGPLPRYRPTRFTLALDRRMHAGTRLLRTFVERARGSIRSVVSSLATRRGQ